MHKSWLIVHTYANKVLDSAQEKEDSLREGNGIDFTGNPLRKKDAFQFVNGCATTCYELITVGWRGEAYLLKS